MQEEVARLRRELREQEQREATEREAVLQRTELQRYRAERQKWEMLEGSDKITSVEEELRAAGVGREVAMNKLHSTEAVLSGVVAERKPCPD